MTISPDDRPGELGYARLTQVVWRLAPDRVLVRRVWPEIGREEAADLLGSAAMVWIALDQPGTAQDIIDRLAEVDQVVELGDLETTLRQLIEHGWIVRGRPPESNPG